MHGHRLLRRLRFASPHHPIRNRTRHGHRPIFKIDVTPFQPEQLALPQSCGRSQQNKSSLPNIEVIGQRLDFIGYKYSWSGPAFRTLTDETDWVSIKQLMRSEERRVGKECR